MDMMAMNDKNDTTVLRTDKLCYSYDSIEKNSALSDVSIKISKGQMTAILGGNGAGKSTLFLNLNGVFTPTSGDIFFCGERVLQNASSIKKLRKHVGIVFQDPNDQLFSASVRNDIAFGALNLGATQEEANLMVMEVARQTGVIDFIDRPTHALSFGQKKRVAIAGVLIMKPEVLILDEPTAGLDPQGVSEILKLLINIKSQTGLSIIIATHDIDIVPLYCDYAYLLNGGRVVGEGTPAEVFSRPDMVRENALRTPRIAHLMEILSDKDGIDVDKSAATISTARSSIKERLLINEK